MMLKLLPFTLLLLLLSGCASNGETDEYTQPTPPKTLEDAVDRFIDNLSEQDKETLRELPASDLTVYSFGWGKTIEQDYGLLGTNKELIVSVCGSEECSSDEAIMMIIYGIWNIVNENDYRDMP